MIVRSIILLALVLPAAAGTITGPAFVTDGDTVRVGTTAVRLRGVDAGERGTARGDAATRAMIKIVNGSTLTCELTGERTWGREVGYCRTSDGVDIGRAIVESGFALACPRYSVRYLPFERPEALRAQARASYCVQGSR